MLRAALAVSTCVAVLSAVHACDGDSATGPPDETLFETGFESDLAGFVPDGADLDDPPVAWSIERSDERAESGAWSVRMRLDNLNDAGKIWLERSFEVEPGDQVVRIAFDFASADFGDVNLWRIVAGASGSDPETRDDLTFQDDTGNGAASDVGFLWSRKEYLLAATAGLDGRIHVFLGIWGTSEFSRDYFVDDVEIRITPGGDI